MTDHDALLRAIAALPDDDTPRLVYADYLDEAGDADHAAFVRAQVEAARGPDWAPAAVFARHRRPDWFTGHPFRRTLPPLGESWDLAWGEPPFRRGLGWRVSVKSLAAWMEVAPRVFDRAPVGELYLNPPATLEDWRRLAAADWVRRLRVVRLDGGRVSEPARALREAEVTGPTDLHFDRASSPGIGFIAADVLKSSLAVTLRGLHFRVGDAGVDDLIDALTPDAARLERLTFSIMGLTPELVRRWCDRGGPRGLAELHLPDNPLGGDGARALAAGLAAWPAGLHTLGLAGVSPRPEGVEALAALAPLASLRRLDLSRNPLTPRATRLLSLSVPLAGLRALNLARCTVGDKGVRHLTRARFWSNLVELDLRENPISAQGVRHLLDAEVPADLTALLIDGTGFGVDSRAALRRKFGDAAIFSG